MFHIPLKYASSYYIFLIQNKRVSPVGLVLGVGTLEYVNLDSLDVDVQFYILTFRLSMNFYILLMVRRHLYTLGSEIMNEDCEGSKKGVSLSCRSCVLRAHRVRRVRDQCSTYYPGDVMPATQEM